MAETIQTFIGGMDFDTDKVLRSNNVTHLVENMRLVTRPDGTAGAKSSIKGNTLLSNIPHVDRIYAHCLINNYLVVFGTYGSNSVIMRYTLTETEDIVPASEVELYSDDKNNNTGLLNFTDNSIKCVGRYESANIIKVYWVDGINPIRYINIAINNTTDGQLYNGITNYYVAPDKLEFVPNTTFNPIQSIKVKKGGTLKAGVVRYIYQYYNKYGVESLFSQPTNPIHIVEYSDTVGTTTKYQGSDIDTNTGKSVELTIQHLDNNNSFDGLKIIRIFYDTFGGTPIVSLVADIEIEKYFSTTSKTYIITDTGNVIDEYLPEEIAVLGNVLFTATDITTKDDLLFASNINENVFDVDFDARAFRFASSPFNLYNVAYLTNDGVNTAYTLSADTPAGWDAWDLLVPETHDAINLYNDLTYDNKFIYSGFDYNCIYQFGVNTIGGSGRNVKYSFVTKDIILDSTSSTSKTSAGVTSNRTISANIDTVDANNYSFTNYASPYISQVYRGYQRGEIYRFAIVFYDVKGRASKPKWIGDIRFPSFKTTGFDDLADRNSSTGELVSDILGIQFQVRNVPTEAVAWSIVRVDRKNIDKTVISQGVLSNIVNIGGAYNLPYFPTLKADGTPFNGNTLETDVLAYISPDINYGDLDYINSDYFETIGHFTDYGTYNHESADNINENTIKYFDFASLASYNTITPDKIAYVEPQYPLQTIELNSLNIDPIVNVASGYDKGILGKCMLFTWTGTVVPSTDTNLYNPTVVNLRRINNSQYGGNTYENRFNNIYIPCGNIVTSDSSSFTRTNTYVTASAVYGGDIFISMYERLHALYEPTSSYQLCRICYIPLESKYNLQLNSGTTYSKSIGSDSDLFLIKEVAGTHSDTSSYVFIQDKDFYIYNTVYSSLDTPITYISESNIDNHITEYKSRVIVSDKKINNEIIDSWSKFSVNDFIDVDSTYGPVNNILTLKNRLFFLQDTAFGILSVNERSVITDTTSPTGIVLGTGGVLDRYDYLSTYYGNTNKYGALSTESGIYWVDNNKAEMLLYNGDGIIPLSKSKKMDSYFKGLYNTIGDVKLYYNPKYNEVLILIINTVGSYLDILVFSELMNCYDYFYTIPTIGFITLNRNLLSIYRELNQDFLYLEDSNDNVGTFYGVKYPSILQILHTENYPYVKVYDNIEYTSSITSSSVTDAYATSFTSIQIYNEYQNTGQWNLILNGTVNNALRQWPITRRERKWNLAIPRNIVNKNVSMNVNIFDPSNLSVTQLFKERIRSGYSMFVFNYRSDIPYGFSVPYIKIIYRISQR